jgi:hypothetical protein
VATNLLLEGDDLEALLIKAHSQGGPNARIVRADKYRHGGLWGFFARERFEVAVEIPEATSSAGAAFYVGSQRDAALPDHGGEPQPDPAAEAGYDDGPDPSPQGPTPEPQPQQPQPPPRPWSDDGYDRTAGRLLQAAAPAPARAEVPSWATTASAPATPAPATPTPATPTPAGPAGGGLLGLADRVSAAERAAARAVEAMIASSARPEPETISLPGTELVGATLAKMTAGTQRGRGPLGGRTVPTASPSSMKGNNPMADYPAGNGPAHERSNGTDLRLGTRPASDPPDALELLRAAAELPPDPGYAPAPGHSPVRPSTSRPEFTALLDQLRDGARPPRRGVAARPAERTPERAEPAVPAPRTPSDSTPSDAADDEAAGHGVRTADPRTAADRRTLRAFGVPAAWTRRLRSGDRFGEVLRMLERMPDPDISPDALVIAVVGPAESVRLEAHRAAVDLAVGDLPRPVVVVPARVGTERAGAIARALRSGPVVLAVETDGQDSGLVLDTLTTVQAGAVIAMVDAATPLERTQRWLDALGQVDALALEGGSDVPDPAAVLQLGLPVIRFDGIPVDRVTWTALLCAQLLAAEPAEQAVVE